jgi:hypothetical protein
VYERRRKSFPKKTLSKYRETDERPTRDDGIATKRLLVSLSLVSLSLVSLSLDFSSSSSRIVFNNKCE